MRSARRGTRTSRVEVTNISTHGFWLLLDEREVFLPFKAFPWFRGATVAQLLNVQRPTSHHLYWPDLDVDLATESIDHPERYPLVSVAPGKITLREPKPRTQSPSTSKAAKPRRRSSR